MSCSTKDEILAAILNCGYADISILDDTKYDVGGFAAELFMDDCLSLQSLTERVVEQGKSDLADAIVERKNQVIADLQTLGKVLPKFDDDEEAITKQLNLIDGDEELADLDATYGIEWGDNLLRYAEEMELIDPMIDIQLDFNYSATHVYLVNHQELYRMFFEEEIEAFEANTGFGLYG